MNGAYEIRHTQKCIDLKKTNCDPGSTTDWIVPNIGWVKAYEWSSEGWYLIELSEILPPSAEIIGTWSNGIWYRDVAAAKWTKMTFSAPTGDIAAGDFTGDGIADVASCWDSGLWYQDGDTLAWIKIPGGAPRKLTAGDVTGN